MLARLPLFQLLLLASFVTPAEVVAQSRDPFLAARQRMVDEYLIAEGIDNERVLEAMRTTPRHEFVRPIDQRSAYHDAALPIGFAQTISPPFVVAYMTATIDPQPTDKVLEIGTGSGYQAAALSPLVKDVYTIEIVEPLGRTAQRKLAQLGYGNVHVKVGDGYQGWPEHAPYDKIIVTCSPEKVPTPLVEQLAEGGKLLIPLGERYQQVFYLLEKVEGKLSREKLIPTLFVPMTGESEDRRSVKPDPLRPELVNGGFETDMNNDGRPDGWHYLRQTMLQNEEAAVGKRSLRIENADAGRLAQALQGFAVDGRKVGGLRLSASLRASEIRPGLNANEPAGVVVFFFDQNRRTISSGHIPPPIHADATEWTSVEKLVPVPPLAREAVLGVTLGGGTGVLEVDEVAVVPLLR